MLEAKAAFDKAGVDFGKHAVAVTGEGSKLDRFAEDQGFIARFPMDDWVGGRTSVLSTVGLVPAALQGLDIDNMLAGAAAMDKKTRKRDAEGNAAMRLAIAWHKATGGKGEKDMVVLPYKDSLVLFSKYLQQLVMESLGKEHDLDGNVVNQGIAVYGNKGSTDQHAYVQQLRDGVNNFFATFIEVRHGRKGKSIEVEPGNTSQDYLQGFLRGTRSALYENGRKSLTISIYEVTPFTLGMLIALFERYGFLLRVAGEYQCLSPAGRRGGESGGGGFPRSPGECPGTARFRDKERGTGRIRVRCGSGSGLPLPRPSREQRRGADVDGQDAFGRPVPVIGLPKAVFPFDEYRFRGKRPRAPRVYEHGKG